MEEKYQKVDITKYLALKHEYGVIDCILLSKLFYEQELGLSFPIPEYPKSNKWYYELTPSYIDSWALTYAKKIPLTSLKNYDLISFSNKRNNLITHFAVYINYSILHLEENSVSKLDRLDSYWIDRIHSIYRHNDLV